MKLYQSAASPYARKCRIAVRELGLTDRVEEIAVAVQPTAPNASYAERVNPLRKVPALEAEDGTVIVDSRNITAYLAERAGEGTLYPPDPARKWPVLSAAALAEGVLDCAVAARYELALRPEERRWEPWTEDLLGKIAATLDWFEARSETLEGPFDIRAVTLAAALGYLDFRFPDVGWRSGRPKLGAWFAAASQRPSLAETMPG